MAEKFIEFELIRPWLKRQYLITLQVIENHLKKTDKMKTQVKIKNKKSKNNIKVNKPSKR